MTQQCPNCLVLVGKLHMRCIWCGLYFCEDCADPHKHYCPAYREDMKLTARTIYRADYSTKRYETFASLDDTEEEIVPELSAKEKETHSREHIIKANLIYQERVRLGVGRTPNQCPNCRSTMNRVDEKCILCGIRFCGYCIDPEKHNCVIYKYECGKHSEPMMMNKVNTELLIAPETVVKQTTVDKPVTVSKPQTKQLNDSKKVKIKEETKTRRIAPEKVVKQTIVGKPVTVSKPQTKQLNDSKKVKIKEETKTRRIAPEKVVKQTIVDKPVTVSKPQTKQLSDSKKVKIKEETKAERKIPLWRRLLSIFGFNH